jgi:hypothetical protein
VVVSVNMVMNLQAVWKVGYIFSSWLTIRFSSMTPLHEVSLLAIPRTYCRAGTTIGHCVAILVRSTARSPTLAHSGRHHRSRRGYERISRSYDSSNISGTRYISTSVSQYKIPVDVIQIANIIAQLRSIAHSLQGRNAEPIKEDA